MKLLIGLGNPGEKYQHNRHNIGIILIDYLSDHLNNSKFILKKSDKFMNSSGEAVEKLANYYLLAPSALFVAHDDLDLPLGEYKIQKGVGPKLHNGINSIEQTLGSSDFWRIRIGVDNRDPNNRIPGEDYVLQDFSKEEMESLKIVFEKIGQELKSHE